ncbi:PREDICTED: fat storage-inducing transmembrane protein 2 [Nanorana parkeri]|uniref:fat storage-inducing transmembrane protein 2 n=1 Tax=Nanorana parkeri TaxID=125878 RepID=UPI0008545963|nr:PREDICTED: fat storage-inducing transmembrane protein 2 [Nanorana parkeri]
MEWLERSSGLVQSRLLGEGLRRHTALGLACVTLGGSLLKEFWPLPDSYFNNKKNFLNVYFVKLSWGWTLSLLLPFIGLTNYIVTRSVPAVFRRISTLLVGTLIWYAFTNVFTYIENATGSCHVSETQLQNTTEHGDKRACIKSGGLWVGFDISGHSFLLPYCVLMILEEAAILRDERIKRHRMKPLIHALVVSLGVLGLIWALMFFCTSIYFHTPLQKVFGTFFGILSWYITYRLWYLKTFSPGLPPTSPPGKIHKKAR